VVDLLKPRLLSEDIVVDGVNIGDPDGPAAFPRGVLQLEIARQRGIVSRIRIGPTRDLAIGAAGIPESCSTADPIG
jgi:hypothetical protein